MRPPALPPRETGSPPEKGARRVVDVQEVLKGGREIFIRHRNEEYRLRLTSNDKLQLTK